MPEEKVSVANAAARCEQEGIGYAVQHYMSGKHIADPECAKLWDEAAAALNKLEAYFEKKMGKNWKNVCYQILDEEE